MAPGCEEIVGDDCNTLFCSDRHRQAAAAEAVADWRGKSMCTSEGHGLHRVTRFLYYIYHCFYFAKNW